MTRKALWVAAILFVVSTFGLIACSGGGGNGGTTPGTATPTIQLSTTSLTPSTTQGANAASQTFTVSNSGGGTLDYSISVDQTWLSCTPTGGTSTDEQDTITVNYATSGLPEIISLRRFFDSTTWKIN
jgi:hypothetical protein